MRFLGKLKSDNKGAGSIIGATFLALILLSGFTFYNLHVTINDHYRNILSNMDQLDLERNQESIEFITVTVTSSNELNITVRNAGSHQTHLIWLGIFDETTSPNSQDYYELDISINPAETITNIPETTITILEGQVCVIQLATELGNTFSYNYPAATTEDSAQSTVTITGKNCTVPYNPSGWSLLGSTANVSGSTTDLASNDSNNAIFNSYYTSIMSNTTLLDDGFEGATWDSNWDSISSNWFRSSTQHNGSYSAGSSNGNEGGFVSDNLDASDAHTIYIDFSYRVDNTETGDLLVYYYDGSNYDQIAQIGGGTEDTWLHYTNSTSDSQYFKSNFRLRFRSILGGSEYVYIDDVVIKKQVGSDEYTAQVEFTGSSNTADWSRVIWQTDSSWNIGQVNVTIQFYNFTLNAYPTGGNGYTNYISDATPNTDEYKTQTITINPAHFKNSTGYWKAKITGVKSNSTQFQMRIDWIEFKPTYSSTGQSIPYNSWQWYTIATSTADGTPTPYVYMSIYANGSSLILQNASDEQAISNPSWLRLDVDGKFHLNLKSTSASTETFILYGVAGIRLGHKTITQEAP